MSIFWPAWEVFVNLIENLLFCILLNKKLGYEPKKSGRIWGGFIGITLIVSLMNQFSIDYRIVMVLIMILDIIYALWAHSGDRGQRIFWGSSSTIIAFIGNTVILNLFSFIQNIDSNDILAQTNIRFQMMSLYLLAILLMFSFLYFLDSKQTAFSWPIQILLLILLTLGTIASGYLIKINFLLTDAHNITKLVVLVSGLFLLIMIGIMFIFEFMGILNKRNLALKLELQQEKLENSHNQRMIEIFEALKDWKHDYNNHLLVLRAYAQDKKYEDLINYLSNMNLQFNQVTSFINTGNTAVDALVSQKLFTATAQGIPVNIAIILSADLPLSTNDLCALIGNLMDNGIEACQRLSEKEISQSYIDFKIEPKLGMLSIYINNRSNGSYLYDVHGLISSKNNKEHGQGLKRIEKIVKSANGFFEAIPNETSFTVNILIPLN